MRKSVFLLDDDPFFQKVIKEMLQSQGFDVTITSSWIEFTNAYYCATPPPDIILFDINLGGSLSGDKLLAALKEGRKKTTSPASTKLVLISALPENELAAIAKHSGADGYLSKNTIFASLGSGFLDHLRSFLR